MDLSKYRNLFLEEASENLAEMSRALLELEKDGSATDAIDRVFRAAHSIKGMAGSLGYDAITEVAHRLEDRMDAHRRRGRVGSGEFTVLFRALDGLERMVGVVRNTAEAPPPDAELLTALAAAPAAQVSASPEPPGDHRKKALRQR